MNILPFVRLTEREWMLFQHCGRTGACVPTCQISILIESKYFDVLRVTPSMPSVSLKIEVKMGWTNVTLTFAYVHATWYIGWMQSIFVRKQTPANIFHIPGIATVGGKGAKGRHKVSSFRLLISYNVSHPFAPVTALVNSITTGEYVSLPRSKQLRHDFVKDRNLCHTSMRKFEIYFMC